MVVIADRTAGKIVAWHLKASWGTEMVAPDSQDHRLVLEGCDYVVPFVTKFPVYSWQVRAEASTEAVDEDEDIDGAYSSSSNLFYFDILLHAYQNVAVQQLTLTSMMLLPPALTWTDPTPGVNVVRLWNVQSAHVSEVSSNEDLLEYQYDEEYDVEDDDDDEEQGYEQAPDASALPLPQINDLNDVATAPATSSINPFSNWLGSLAANKHDSVLPLPPAMPPPGMTFLPGNLPPPPADPAIISVTSAPPMFFPESNTFSMAKQPDVRALTPPTSNRSKQRQPPFPAVVTSNSATAPSAPTMVPSAPTMMPSASTMMSSASTMVPSAPIVNPPMPLPIVSTPMPLPVVNPPIPLPVVNPPMPLPVVNPPMSMPVVNPPMPLPVVNPPMAPPVDTEEIRRIVREELNASLDPAIQQAVRAVVDEAILRPLQASIAQASERGLSEEQIANISSSVTSSVDVPIRAAFNNIVKIALLPALESCMGQAFQQVSDRLEEALAVKETSESNNKKELDAVSNRLARLTELVGVLTTEFRALRATVEREQAPAQAVPATRQAQQGRTTEDLKRTILHHLSTGNFQEAFNTAFTVPDFRMTFFCCQNADVSVVLNGPRPKITKPAQLCVMQHLAYVLHDTKDDAQMNLSLQWLQELAISIDPPTPDISQHLPRVLDELTRIIRERMERDPARQRDFTRLLQCIRGIQIT